MAPAGAPDAALSAAEFARLMAGFEPFEPSPHLAVAVSGGADSMALALLTHAWAEARGGRVTALTVDHRLRPQSAAEAAEVGRAMAARGIPHFCLVRDGGPLSHDVQAAARRARYGLLEAWCAAEGVLHLLTAHHREDQAETLLLRLGRGSGLDGLAGMAAAVERPPCRVLRPLLGVPRARLRATLSAAGERWIEDPSNRNRAFARVRLRQAMPLLAAEGLTEARLAATAARLARARAALDAAVAELLAHAVMLHPLGFACLDAAALKRAPEEVGLRALAALVVTVAGAEHTPRLERLERLYHALSEGLAGGRTLGGCRVLPRRQGILVCREPAAVAPPVAAPPGRTTRWDGRFNVMTPAAAPPGLMLGALGQEAGGREAGAFSEEGPGPRLPAAVRATLPALRDGAELWGVPQPGPPRPDAATLLFRPVRPLAPASFRVV
jgi:tRNA(Ile)-lysidine synthase